jgi:type III restriction enzyme
LASIQPARIALSRRELEITEAGVSAERELETRARSVGPAEILPDLLGFLQKETELTRHTLADIVRRSGRIKEFRVNPQAFMTETAREISRALRDLMLEGIRYEKIADHYWERQRPGWSAT